MDIQNREIEFHRWQLVDLSPIQTRALDGLQFQLMITIYPLCEGKPPPLKAYFSHKDNYIAFSVLHLNADLASRCFRGQKEDPT